MNFMRFIAEELREIMARLGVRTVDGTGGPERPAAGTAASGYPRAARVDLT